MKYDENLKIELSHEKWTKHLRCYYWRVCPNQLSWWNRLFNNPWIKFERACDDHWSDLFHPEDYWEDLAKLETISDVVKYREREWEKIKIERDKYIKHKIKFPYDD